MDSVRVVLALCGGMGDEANLADFMEDRVISISTTHVPQPTKVIFQEPYGISGVPIRVNCSVVVDASLRNSSIKIRIKPAIGTASITQLSGAQEEVNEALKELSFLPPEGFAGRTFLNIHVEVPVRGNSSHRTAILIEHRPSPVRLQGDLVQAVGELTEWKLRPLRLLTSGSPHEHLRVAMRAAGSVDVPDAAAVSIDEDGAFEGTLFEVNDVLARLRYTCTEDPGVEDVLILEVSLEEKGKVKSFSFEVRLILPPVQCHPRVTPGKTLLEGFQDDQLLLSTMPDIEDCSGGKSTMIVNVTYLGENGVLIVTMPHVPSVRLSGNNSRSMEFTGRKSFVEHGMEAVVFVPQRGWNTRKATGPEEFVWRVAQMEDGRRREGATVHTYAYVLAVNAPPLLSIDTEERVVENNGYPFNGLRILDEDCVDNDAIYDVTVNTSEGITLSLDADKGVTKKLPHKDRTLRFSVKCTDAEWVSIF